MPDLETLIVKGGIVILAALAVLRLIVFEVRNFKDELSRGRRRQSKHR